MAEHIGQWNAYSEVVQVSNSLPNVLISNPISGIYTDSSELIHLDSIGSGDYDLSCSELPDNGSGLLCNPTCDDQQGPSLSPLGVGQDG